MTPSLLQKRHWRPAIILSLVAAVSGVALVGLSAGFLGAVAIAGLGPMAYAFNFHPGAATVRFLALLRTGARYGERMTGHAAALTDQVRHRQSLFRGMASAAATRRSGWQLSRDDRLQAFLGDVEAVENEALRAHLPLVSLVSIGAALLVFGLIVAPLSVPLLLAEGALFCLLGRPFLRRADRASAAAETRAAALGERLGQQLSSVSSLAGDGTRGHRIGASLAVARTIEGDAAASRASLGWGDAILSSFGLIGAVTVLGVEMLTGQTGTALLPALILSFGILAYGEMATGFLRTRFASLSTRRARERLSPLKGEEAEASDAILPGPIAIRDLPISSPDGRALGVTVSLELAPGAPVALLGPSGIGKTSALKILAGWLPWTGAAKHPFGSEADARGLCHLGLHDAAILKGTVRENLFSAADNTALWTALEAVELRERIDAAGGLDGTITQSTLSLGEARRFSLARAMLSEAPVILLDEPGEHLGTAQGDRILARLLTALHDRIVVFVTHDEALAAQALSVVRLRA